MGFCDTSGDNIAFVTATYVVALLPWSVISFWDPINRNWRPYWKTWVASWLYLLVSIMPYFLLIPYSVLQGCSTESDIKELLTAVVTMFASIWNLRRALRGLAALKDIRLVWEQVNIWELCLCFEDWIVPESRRGSIPNANLSKLDTVDILISHNLVDNDWPGEAPQTQYLWKAFTNVEEANYFPEVRAVDSDQLRKKCILILWCLWMSYGNDSRFESTLFVKKSDSWIRDKVRWLLINVCNVSQSRPRRIWDCPECRKVPEIFKETNSCAWCSLRPLVTRAAGVHNAYGELDSLVEFELLDQLSSFPPKVQGALRPTDGARIQHLYYSHYGLDETNRMAAEKEHVISNYLCPASRMGRMLGFSKTYDNFVRNWLQTTEKEDGTTENGVVTLDNISRKFLAFAVLLTIKGEPRDIVIDHGLWSLERHLHHLGRLVQSVNILLRDGTEARPLEILYENDERRWSNLMGCIIGADWLESSKAQTWNIAVVEELKLLHGMLAEAQLPRELSERFIFSPSCVDFGFNVIGDDMDSFYNENYLCQPAASTIKSNSQAWEERGDQRKIVWRSRSVDFDQPVIFLEAAFGNLVGDTSWRVGLSFRFPSWTNQEWPRAGNSGILFVVSVFDAQNRLTFITEELDVFHFAHFTKAKPWTRKRKLKISLETKHMLSDNGVVWGLTEPPTTTLDHSSWRVYECSDIPTAEERSTIRLSLQSEYSTSPFEDAIEVDSFWISQIHSHNPRLTVSQPNGHYFSPTISAFKKRQ